MSHDLMPTSACVRVVLPSPLRILAGAAHEERVSLTSPATMHAVVDALEAMYPMLRGTIRDRSTNRRRAFIRFFACARDWSLHDMAEPLPDPVRQGEEPLLIVGAMAGG